LCKSKIKKSDNLEKTVACDSDIEVSLHPIKPSIVKHRHRLKLLEASVLRSSESESDLDYSSNFHFDKSILQNNKKMQY